MCIRDRLCRLRLGPASCPEVSRGRRRAGGWSPPGATLHAPPFPSRIWTASEVGGVRFPARHGGPPPFAVVRTVGWAALRFWAWRLGPFGCPRPFRPRPARSLGRSPRFRGIRAALSRTPCLGLRFVLAVRLGLVEAPTLAPCLPRLPGVPGRRGFLPAPPSVGGRLPHPEPSALGRCTPSFVSRPQWCAWPVAGCSPLGPRAVLPGSHVLGSPFCPPLRFSSCARRRLPLCCWAACPTARSAVRRTGGAYLVGPGSRTRRSLASADPDCSAALSESARERARARERERASESEDNHKGRRHSEPNRAKNHSGSWRTIQPQEHPSRHTAGGKAA